jgi:hypothetical protein
MHDKFQYLEKLVGKGTYTWALCQKNEGSVETK